MAVVSYGSANAILIKQRQPDSQFEALLADAFRRAGWKVQRGARARNRVLDLLVARSSYASAVEIKVSSEARRDRVLPLLSQAILQAQAAARDVPKPAAPLAVIAAPHISESLVSAVREFVSAYAPAGVAVGLIDLDGLRFFIGPGLELLNAPHESVRKRIAMPPQASA